jgi:hypothetical protein
MSRPRAFTLYCDASSHLIWCRNPGEGDVAIITRPPCSEHETAIAPTISTRPDMLEFDKHVVCEIFATSYCKSLVAIVSMILKL